MRNKSDSRAKNMHVKLAEQNELNLFDKKENITNREKGFLRNNSNCYINDLNLQNYTFGRNPDVKYHENKNIKHPNCNQFLKNSYQNLILTFP